MRAHSFGFSFILGALTAGAVVFETPAPALSYDRAETVPASGSPSQSFSEYPCADAGLVFTYPRGWAVKTHPDKDVELKFVGSVDNAYGELSVSVKNDPALNSEKTLKLMQTIYFPQIPGFKALTEKRIVFGNNREFQGFSEEINTSVGDSILRQRYVFIDHAGKVIVLTFTSPAAQFEKLLPLYNDMLLGVHKLSSAGVAHAAAATGWHLARFHEENVPLNFGYPENWTVAKNPGDSEHPVVVNGTDPAGHPAMMALLIGDLHPAISTEQAVQDLEDRHFSKAPGYRRTGQETATFGPSVRVTGVVHESSFTQDGLPALQKVVFIREGNQLYALVLRGVAWKENELELLFRKIMATVDFN